MTDLEGREITRGTMLRGYGLHNAGVTVKVLKLGRKVHMSHMILVEGQLTGRRRWVGTRWYRVVDEISKFKMIGRTPC